jgi:alkylation response protein AidB-like acyl-CoA dehydrogenase
VTAVAPERRRDDRGAATPTADPDEAFRDELRSWLRDHPPPALDVAATPDDAEAMRSWQRTLHADGWVGVNWPVEYGGRGAPLTQLAIYNEELARAGAPQILGRAGVSLVGPTLMAHGTDAQRARWMPRILAGDDVWCQLFSEPDAGSDLASLATRAVRRGDTYIVTGQKVWSSHARWADWGIALARTDPTAAPHHGISMLAIPMTAAGVGVRPLRQMTGDSEFNEVFLDDVEVPAENRIGPEHEGWRVANTTLANERGATFVWKEQLLQAAALRDLWTCCRRRGRLTDPRLRQRLAQAWIETEIFRLHNARTLARLGRGEELSTESSLVKLWWATTSQRLAETAIGALGPEALLSPEDPQALDHGRWSHSLLATRANSIMGGTSEIQRTIVGERLLGLPREPRPS